MYPEDSLMLPSFLWATKIWHVYKHVSVVMLISWGWQPAFCWERLSVLRCFLKMLSHVHLLLGLLPGMWSSVLPVSFMCGWGAVSDRVGRRSAHPHLRIRLVGLEPCLPWKGKAWGVPCRRSPAQQLSPGPPNHLKLSISCFSRRM